MKLIQPVEVRISVHGLEERVIVYGSIPEYNRLDKDKDPSKFKEIERILHHLVHEMEGTKYDDFNLFVLEKLLRTRERNGVTLSIHCISFIRSFIYGDCYHLDILAFDGSEYLVSDAFVYHSNQKMITLRMVDNIIDLIPLEVSDISKDILSILESAQDTYGIHEIVSVSSNQYTFKVSQPFEYNINAMIEFKEEEW